MSTFFNNSSLMKPESVVATVIPTDSSITMLILDTDKSGGDKYIDGLWSYLNQRNPDLMSGIVLESKPGGYQFTVEGLGQINNVLKILFESKEAKYASFALEIWQRFEHYLDDSHFCQNQ